MPQDKDPREVVIDRLTQALLVFLLTPQTRRWLIREDPQAVKQAVIALKSATNSPEFRIADNFVDDINKLEAHLKGLGFSLEVVAYAP